MAPESGVQRSCFADGLGFSDKLGKPFGIGRAYSASDFRVAFSVRAFSLPCLAAALARAG